MNQSLTLVCPSCGGRTKISNGADWIVCDYCGNTHIFQLPRQGGARNRQTEEAQNTNRKLVPRPDGVSLQRKSGRIELSWRWFAPKYIFMLFFVIAWDGFLIFWYSMAFGSSGAPWIMFVFPIAHVAVGIFLTYTTLAGFFNRTTIKIDRKKFVVHHDPFPWPGEVNVPVSDLDQLYCTKQVNRGKNGTSISYQLRALLKDGRECKLITNLDSPEVGFFLEGQVEAILKIPDRQVAGEMAM